MSITFTTLQFFCSIDSNVAAIFDELPRFSKYSTHRLEIFIQIKTNCLLCAFDWRSAHTRYQSNYVENERGGKLSVSRMMKYVNWSSKQYHDYNGLRVCL